MYISSSSLVAEMINVSTVKVAKRLLPSTLKGLEYKGRRTKTINFISVLQIVNQCCSICVHTCTCEKFTLKR